MPEPLTPLEAMIGVLLGAFLLAWTLLLLAGLALGVAWLWEHV